MTSSSERLPAEYGFEAVTAYLRGHRVQHDVVEHDPAMSATEEARLAAWPPEQVAKTVVLQDGAAYVLAVVPASERLDLHKVRERLGASRRLRLATEEELAADLPGVEVGATPPVGTALPAAELVDRRLLDHERVVFLAGDHRHSIALDPAELARLSGATIGDFSLEE